MASDLGAGERDRTADLPFTRSTASCSERPICTDGAGYCTDCISCAETIRFAVPRTVPRGDEHAPKAVTKRSDLPLVAASTKDSASQARTNARPDQAESDF